MLRDYNLTGFEYKPNQMQEGYLQNWFVEYNLMCLSKNQISQTVSLNFLGYFFGALLVFFPDTFGRKKSMLILLPFVAVSQVLILFGTDL